MTEEDFLYHVDGEEDCGVRGDIFTTLVKLKIITFEMSRVNFMKMLMHASQQEVYQYSEKWKDYDGEE